MTSRLSFPKIIFCLWEEEHVHLVLHGPFAEVDGVVRVVGGPAVGGPVVPRLEPRDTEPFSSFYPSVRDGRGLSVLIICCISS